MQVGVGLFKILVLDHHRNIRQKCEWKLGILRLMKPNRYSSPVNRYWNRGFQLKLLKMTENDIGGGRAVRVSLQSRLCWNHWRRHDRWRRRANRVMSLIRHFSLSPGGGLWEPRSGDGGRWHGEWDCGSQDWPRIQWAIGGGIGNKVFFQQ